MARTQRSVTRVVYQIKVTLKGIKPPVWRRIQVAGETTLAQLHRILQRVMGRTSSSMNMTLAIAGNTSCSLKRYYPWKTGSATPSASRANAPVPPRIAVASGDMLVSCRRSKIQSTPSMTGY